MTEPLTREEQEQLLRSSRERLHRRSRNWINDPKIRRHLAEPAPEQEESEYEEVEVKLEVA